MRKMKKRSICFKADEFGGISQLEIPSNRKTELGWKIHEPIEAKTHIRRDGTMDIILQPGRVEGNRNRLCRARCRAQRYVVRFKPAIRGVPVYSQDLEPQIIGRALWITTRARPNVEQAPTQLNLPLFANLKGGGNDKG